LIVGDIMSFETGEIFAIDGILISGQDVMVNESDMTGESDNIKKTIPVTYM